jgi:alpha-glucosidase
VPTVIYQIFVDRFCAARTGPGRRAWDEPPEAPPQGRDLYGGDLDGLTGRLGHLVSLGVDAVYLTPIFAAPSNHKYDTADYDRIDPAFGDEGSFQRMVTALRQRGIGLILDGVFNHVGETHAWTRDRRHLLTGSYWRGYTHVPEVDLRHPEVREAFFGEEGVIWSHGLAAGLRK